MTAASETTNVLTGAANRLRALRTERGLTPVELSTTTWDSSCRRLRSWGINTFHACMPFGYEWLYVLSGELRLLLGGHDLTMKAGEFAEFDTQLPRGFGAAGDQPVEVLSHLSRPGERAHIHAAPRRKKGR